MGAQYDEAEIQGNIPESELNEHFQQICENRRYEHGHGGYSGTFAETYECRPSGKTFKTINSAQRWTEDTAQKWEAALYSRVEPDDEPPYWYFGAICSS